MNLSKLLIILILLMSNITAKNLEKVSIQLDWLHQFQFAGYYIAKEKGYFEDEGLDVNIKEFNFNVNLLDDVLNFKSEYAIGKSSLIIDRLEGKQVVLLSAIYQESPMVLISLKNSNINKPTDLKNKKVMLTPDARSTASINSMIISQGLKLKDINFQPHSFKLEDLINGTTDAMGCYISNEPYILSKKNIDFTIHNPSDYGFDFYGGLLFTSKDELNNHPSRVKGIYKATLKGWEYAFNNIEETSKLIFEKFNTQKKSLDSLIYEGYALKKLAQYDKGLLGKIDLEKIEEIKRLYLLLGLKKDAINFRLDDLIYDVNKIALSKEEKDYLKDNPITLLSNSNFPPFTIKNDKIISGIELDYWNIITKKLNIKKNINIIEESYEAVKEIKNNVNYIKFAYSSNDYTKNTTTTKSITNIKIGLATLINKPFISDISELDNKRIAISKYSTLYSLFKNKYPNINYVEVDDFEEGLKLTSQKKVFGLIGKLPSLSYAITQKSLTNMKISGTFDEKFKMKLLLNNENEILKNILNKAIYTIKDEEKYKIKNKYYSVIYQTTIDYSWLYKIVVPLLIIIIIVIISNRKLNKEVKKRKIIEEKLHKVANVDALTNVYNRRKIESLYNRELIRVKRYQRELSIIFFDIDDFKLINDQLGHAIGDEVLIKLSTVVKNNIRSTDFFGRWGGEEFVIILPETNKIKATNVAHILKEKISATDFNIEKEVTCSFGVSQFEETDSGDSLLTRADDAMYYVKRNGKNNVKVV
ncbi:diguanylate cyclase [Arcobacter sp. LA11]|uniref:transporter substrate-binding domain-containing diguanylate cyclase n=1 Tax=Arcobacter sp. LA11 TaxID=1898176 RepID=UPI000933B8C9|nr:diguanylate cyclase [Arcobacter sp. LA11]